MFRRCLSIAKCIALSSSLPAQQAGSLDQSFNATEAGNYVGDGAFGGPVRAILHQPDGRLLLGGSFINYNEVPAGKVARVNVDGTADATFQTWPGCNGEVYAMALQPDGKVIIGGLFTHYNGVPRSCIARLHSDGSLDTDFDPGNGITGMPGQTRVNSIALLNDGKILLAGNFTAYGGTTRNHVVRVNADGSLDTTFDPGAGPDEGVNVVKGLTNGKVLIGGPFTSFSGTPRGSIARLNANGTLDVGFNPGTRADGPVERIVVRSDGSLYIGGRFFTYNDTPRMHVARLQVNGALDTGYEVTGLHVSGWVYAMAESSTGSLYLGGNDLRSVGGNDLRVVRVSVNGVIDPDFDIGSGPNATVTDIVLLSDGKTAITGGFSACDGVTMFGHAVLEANGSPVTAYNPGSGFNNDRVQQLIVQPDGRILARGMFKGYGAVPREGFARLLADGTLDTSFEVAPWHPYFFASNKMALQPDGKIVVVGGFSTFGGAPYDRILRLNSDGSLDAGFDPGSGLNGGATDVGLQPDGRMVVVGSFTQANGMARQHLARFNADGSLDASFDPGPGPDQAVSAVHVLSDGRILIAGAFANYAGVPRNRIARLFPDGSLDPSFDPGQGADGLIRHITVLPDGRILVGFNFNNYNGVPRRGLARLLADGMFDPTFNAEIAFDNPEGIVVAADGSIIVVGGTGTTYSGIPRSGVARLFPDGQLDTDFDPGAGTDRNAHAAALTADDLLLVGGAFGNYDGIGRNRIVRVFLSGSVGIDAPSPSSALALFPNPSDGLLNVEVGDGTFSQGQLRVLAMDGRVVQQQRMDGPRASLDVQHYATGTYLLELTAEGGGRQVQRFVKQ